MAGPIRSNLNVMAATAGSFDGSAGRMDEAHSALKAADAELEAAWTGVGADKFATMKTACEAYCAKMAEVARIEAANIRQAGETLADADSGLAAKLQNTGE